MNLNNKSELQISVYLLSCELVTGYNEVVAPGGETCREYCQAI